MNTHQWKARKVMIVGAGAVGSTFAYALAQSGIADEIAIFDRNQDLMAGQVLDLAHGLPYFPSIQIHEGQESDYADAHVIVITAGAKQQPGESRLDLLQRNVAIMEGIVMDIANQNSQAVILVVSNPVDILTYIALKKLNWSRGRVFGSGTALDSARLRYLLSQHCDIDVHNVHAYMLGEHGDSEFAAWSMTHVAGIPIDAYCPECRTCESWDQERTAIVDMVRNSAYHIIDYKGSTYFAVGMALVRIVGAILRNQRSVLTVSTLLEGEYGLQDVCLSVPCVVAQQGVERVIQGNLNPTERGALSHSAAVLQTTLASLRQ
jgi:L-lactate dehydrogenase